MEQRIAHSGAATATPDATEASTSRTYTRSLSHTRMDTYGQCGMRWRLTYIDRVPQAPGGQLLLGIGLHAAIEHAGNELLAGLDAPDVLTLQAVFSNTFEQERAARDAGGCIERAHLNELAARGLAMVRAFAADVLPHYAPVAVEEAFATALPGSNGWRYTGRIDARTLPVQPDGRTTRTTVDFKSASKVPDHRKLVAYEQQALAYALAEVLGSVERSEQTTFIVFVDRPPRYAEDDECDSNGLPLRHAETRVYRYYPSSEDALAFADEVRDVVYRIERGEFAPNPTPLCAWCAVSHACTAGQTYLAERNRPLQPEIARFHTWLRQQQPTAQHTAQEGV